MASIQARRPTSTTTMTKTIVSTKSTWAGTWKDQPYLYAVSANSPVGPEVGQASFLWRYGLNMQNDKTTFKAYAPKDLSGQYVRIQKVTDSGTRKLLWVGILTDSAFDMKPPVDDTVTGDQIFTAYKTLHGLKREQLDAAMAYVEKDWTTWADPAVKEYEIASLGWFPPFNARDRKGTGIIGNRSAQKANVLEEDAKDCYVFGGTDIWTHEQAVEYILAYHSPVGWTITLTGQREVLANIRSVYHAEGLSVKQAIDHLVDKHRAAAYQLVADGEGSFDLKIHSALEKEYSMGGGTQPTYYEKIMFVDDGLGGLELQVTTTQQDPGTSDDATIPANSEIISIDLDDDSLIGRAVVNISSVTRYDQVHAIGGRITSCFTLGVEDGTLIPGWTADQEQRYAQGSGDGADDAANDMERATDKYVNVYQRFEVPTDYRWKWRSWDGERIALWAEGDGQLTDTHSPVMRAFKEFLQYLPVKDPATVGSDEPGPMRPIAFAKRGGQEAVLDQYVQLDLHKPANPHLRVVPGSLAVVISPNPNHLMAHNKFDPPTYNAATTYAAGDRVTSSGTIYESVVGGNIGNDVGDGDYWDELWDSPAATTVDTDNPDDTGAVDYGTLLITVAMLTDERLWVKAARTHDALFENELTLKILVEDADAAYVVPGTVREVSEGELWTDSGSIVRNNASFLHAVAHQALAWYGTQRAALKVTWNTANKSLHLGAMIKEIGSGRLKEDVNTVITNKEWDFVNDTFSITTGHARFDGRQGQIDFPGLSGPAAVSREIKRMRGELGEIDKRTLNIPARFGSGGGSSSSGSGVVGDPRDWGFIVWDLQGGT